MCVRVCIVLLVFVAADSLDSVTFDTLHRGFCHRFDTHEEGKVEMVTVVVECIVDACMVVNTAMESHRVACMDDRCHDSCCADFEGICCRWMMMMMMKMIVVVSLLCACQSSAVCQMER